MKQEVITYESNKIDAKVSRPSSALKLCYEDETRTFGQHIWKQGYAKNTYKTMVKLW